MQRALWMLTAALVCAACSGKEPQAPMPDKKPTRLEAHGQVRIDDYYWLRERDNPDVLAYLEAENAFADEVMSSWSGLRETVLAELESRIRQVDESVPYRDGEWFYYYRYEEGKEYPVYARRKGSRDAPEQVLLDVNAGAAGHDFYSVRGFTVSPDHRKAVYGVDTRGRGFYTLHFLDLDTGESLPDLIEDVTGNAEWAADNRTLLYSRQDPETLRSCQVWRHPLGASGDALVYQEDDEANSVWVEKSLVGRYLFLVSAETVSTEVRYIPADAPGRPPQLFLPRSGEHEYYVTDGGDRFYVLSNDGAVNFQLFETPLDDTSRHAWQLVVPHRGDVLIESVEVLKDWLVLNTMENGLAQIGVVPRPGGDRYRIAFDEPAYTVYPSDNYVYDTSTLRYVYESMTTPESTFDFDLGTRERTLLREEEVPGGFDKARYRTERIFATARDGTKIPISMVYRKGMRKDGGNPLLQYGYGSYGITIEPDFDPDRLSLLDRGFIFAIAHVRGSSLYGREWYYAGRQLNKMNTFTDFIDVSRFLIDEGYTSPAHLYARGGSAGGLLMGAVMNMAPELYHGVSTRVPFVDVVTTMQDESIPLTTFEFDEWGNPAEKVFYDYMLQYSPYDNVRAQAYPHLLVTTGLHDSQVQYWEPAKWVAKLREHKTDDHLLLLKTDLQAGHSGKTGRFRSLEDTALYYAFFLHLEAAGTDADRAL